MSHITRSKEMLWQAGCETVLAAPQNYIDIDVEADGIAGHGSLLAIGAQAPTGESYYSEIRPAFAEFLQGHRDFCDTHGLDHERLMDEAREYRQVIPEFIEWLESLKSENGNKPPVFTAFNASFDFAFIDLYCAKLGINNPFGIASFDLKSYAAQLSGDHDWTKTRKSQLPPEILPEGDFTHHALEDAQYQQKLHFGMVALLGSKVIIC